MREHRKTTVAETRTRRAGSDSQHPPHSGAPPSSCPLILFANGARLVAFDLPADAVGPVSGQMISAAGRAIEEHALLAPLPSSALSDARLVCSGRVARLLQVAPSVSVPAARPPSRRPQPATRKVRTP